MPALQNDARIRALLRQPTSYTPVWLMRQAGRYLPEYNDTRRRAGSFLALCKTPSLAAEVTLQPLERFPLDAAILFSDILTIPDAMGLGLDFSEGEGPRLARPLREEGDVKALRAVDLERLRYVFAAVAEIRRALAGRVPLIGFAGSSSPRAAGSGWRQWRRSAARASASIGRATLRRRGWRRATESRCRAIWTRMCCSDQRRRWCAKRSASSTPWTVRPVTCSTW